MKRTLVAGVSMGALLVIAGGASLAAQQSAASRKPLETTPVVFDSTSRGPSGVQIPGPKFRVVPVKGLQRPQGMAFLPDGRILVTERAGRLRIIASGALDPQPVSGLPAVLNRNMRGLNDVALHPKFAENGWVYFTYYKPHPTETDAAAATLARGKFDGAHALSDVTDLFTADTYVTGPSTAKILFAPDGTLFLGIGIPIPPRPRPGLATPLDAQNPSSVYGKILRLKDDGSVPPDNPFVGRPGHRGEIYAMGIRNAMGLAINPASGELWETENGPQGGDELNIIRPGKNYGWPIISYGRSYSGDAIGETGPVKSPAVAEGMEQPLLFWSPSLALTGMVFYTGDRFPEWKDSLFVGAMVGEQIQRVVFNMRGLPIRRDPLMWELGQRIRDVQQGPDGLLYALTEEDDGALLRIEPAH